MSRDRLRLKLGDRILEIDEAPGVHPVDDVARVALKRLPVKTGDKVLDIGCGTGVYGLAAGMLGAGEVLFTDLDPRLSGALGPMPVKTV